MKNPNGTTVVTPTGGSMQKQRSHDHKARCKTLRNWLLKQYFYTSDAKSSCQTMAVLKQTAWCNPELESQVKRPIVTDLSQYVLQLYVILQQTSRVNYSLLLLLLFSTITPCHNPLLHLPITTYQCSFKCKLKTHPFSLCFNEWLSVLTFLMHSRSSAEQGGHNNPPLTYLLTSQIGVKC